MERQFTLSEGTRTLLNAIFDLENLTNSAYSMIRETLSDDSVSDPTGQDLLDASLNLRERLEHYLRGRFDEAFIDAKNLGSRAVI